MRFLRFFCLLLAVPVLLAARPFMVMVYNVENLFDADGVALFEDYQPENYTPAHVLTKLRNITQVLRHFEAGRGPDIILFQEIEVDLTNGEPPPDYAEILRRYEGLRVAEMLGEAFSPEIADLPAEALLLKALHDAGMTGYTVVRPESVKSPDSPGPLAQRCVVFTRFPVKHSRVYPTLDARPIHEVLVEVEGAPLYLFNNHWKSGAGNPATEPARVANARTLRNRLDEILKEEPNADIILGGDFNSQYNQNRRYPEMKVTGLNDALGSQGNELAIRGRQRDLYNLWFELPPEERGSDTYQGEWGTLMQMIITRGLYDFRGVQYVDNSFGVARIPGLNSDAAGLPVRWSAAGPAGHGFSDHFPIYARFTTVAANRPDRYLPLPNASVDKGKDAVVKVDYSGLDLAKLAVVLSSLPESVNLRDGGHTGRIFLVEGTVGAGTRFSVDVRGESYDLWVPVPAQREQLRAAYAADAPIRFYGELGQHRGRWQFVIHDESWVR